MVTLTSQRWRLLFGPCTQMIAERLQWLRMDMWHAYIYIYIYIYIFHVAKSIRQQPNSTWDASICKLGESKFCKFCRGLHDAFHFLVKSDDLQPPNLQVTEGEGIQTRAFEHIQYDLQQYSYFFEKENCCFLKSYLNDLTHFLSKEVVQGDGI